jgi:hypothetical protein
MKTLFAALALATLIAAPAFTRPAAAARARDAREQNYNGYYRGYPLEDWYRTDGW